MNNNKFKVLHICTKDSGGAGLCCLRIHKAMLDLGIDSKVLVLQRSNFDVEKVYTNKTYRFKWSFWRVYNKILRKLHLQVTNYNKAIALSSKIGVTCSIPTSIFDLSTNRLVRDADIIHFHWVDNFVDYPSFFRKVDKPIIWTLHDEGLFSGVYHFVNGKSIESNLEEKFYPIKLKAIRSKKKLGIVFLSKMMFNQFHDDAMVEGRKMTIINNPVDCDSFKPISKIEARKIMNIPADALVFSFASYEIADDRKGLKILSDTLKNMNLEHAWILAIGNITDYKEMPFVHPVGSLHGSRAMSVAYSCADYFVMPSKKEAFAQTPMESMACGVPAIVFPVSGTDELINSKNGVRAKNFTPQDLEVAIRQAMLTKYDAASIRQDMINRFSPEIIAKKYMEFYDEILNNKS